jgi:hypothetical protein
MKFLRALRWCLAISFVALVVGWLFSPSPCHGLLRFGSFEGPTWTDSLLFAGSLLLIIAIFFEPVIARWFGKS